jgi:ProP effector
MSDDDLIAKLTAIWPQAFFINQDAKKPLKLGIHADMAGQAHGFSDAELRRALSQYCRSPGYLAACTEGATRVDLNGEPAGTVDAAGAARQREVRAKQKVVERQPEKAATKAAPMRQDKNNNGLKRLSLSDLRIAAQQRRAAGHHQNRS